MEQALNNEIVTRPLVTLIIPVYNVRKYLEQCFDCVVSQEYDNLEIIVIDDGSTDGSGEIVEKYALNDKRFFIKHTENRGLSEARNTALDLAHGEYIAFLDSDDWQEPDTIKQLVQNALLYNADIVVGGVYREWINKTEVDVHFFSNTTVLSGKDACYEQICRDKIGPGIWDKLYRTCLFSEIRFPTGRVYEDLTTTPRLLAAANKVVLIPNILFHYRMRDSSISNTLDLKNIEDYWEACHELFLEWGEKGECYRSKLLQKCMNAIRRIWFSYSEYSGQNKSSEYLTRKKRLYNKMSMFAHSHWRKIIKGNYSNEMKCVCSLALCDFPIYLKLLSTIRSVKVFFKNKKEEIKERYA